MYIYKDDMFCESEEKPMCMFPDNIKLATAYVPYQNAKCMLSPQKALCEGTIFPDLVMPYQTPSFLHPMQDCGYEKCKMTSDCNDYEMPCHTPYRMKSDCIRKRKYKEVCL